MDDLHVGYRVECEGVRGTVVWSGEVTGTEGTWYGVDWDDHTRGKHDGSHKGTKYFNTRHPTSGSFVRAGKVSTGVTLEAAIRGRYQDDTTIETQVTEQLQRTIKARFVEVVGMDKVGAQQSQLEYLENVVVGGWGVWGSDGVDLSLLLPRVKELDLSCSLLPSWSAVAHITRQLPRLRLLNISGNKLTLPGEGEDLEGALNHVTHLVLNNMLGYTWSQLLTCCTFCPGLIKLQVAFNELKELSAIPPDQLTCLEDLDIGVNPLADWQYVAQLGTLPKLASLNANSCGLKHVEFPETAGTEKTPLFPCLKYLTLATNPLDSWESIGELDKLQCLEELVITYDEKATPYFQEFTLARIASLKVLNRSRMSPKEKRDCELFYIKTFSNEYFNSGGQDDPNEATLTEDFKQKHPAYLRLVQEHGSPADETQYKTKKSQKLRDLKVDLTIITPDDNTRESCVKSFLPATRVAKVKMMLKRHLKINPASVITLSFGSKVGKNRCNDIENELFVIPMENDMQELSFYSPKTGDILFVRW